MFIGNLAAQICRWCGLAYRQVDETPTHLIWACPCGRSMYRQRKARSVEQKSGGGKKNGSRIA